MDEMHWYIKIFMSNEMNQSHKAIYYVFYRSKQTKITCWCQVLGVRKSDSPQRLTEMSWVSACLYWVVTVSKNTFQNCLRWKFSWSVEKGQWWRGEKWVGREEWNCGVLHWACPTSHILYLSTLKHSHPATEWGGVCVRTAACILCRLTSKTSGWRHIQSVHFKSTELQCKKSEHLEASMVKWT